MTKNIFSILFFLLLTLNLFAQSNNLRLKVVDQNNLLVPNISIKFKSNNKTIKEIVKENPQEVVISKIEQGRYLLEIEAAGFKKYSQEVEINEGKNELTIKHQSICTGKRCL
jgi:flagellar hook assembly protein FlgD